MVNQCLNLIMKIVSDRLADKLQELLELLFATKNYILLLYDF